MGTGGTSGSGSDKTKGAMNIEGYPVKGLSIAGHETCVMFPTLKLAFDIGRFPQQAISHDFLCISHAHMDHIGGLPMYVATRGLFSMKPPTILVPKCIKKDVEQLFEVHRRMDQSELKHNLIGLDVGEEFYLRKDLKVRAFQTYHAIPSQGYVVYSIRQKLKQEYVGLSGNEIKNLKSSGVEVCLGSCLHKLLSIISDWSMRRELEAGHGKPIVAGRSSLLWTNTFLVKII